MPVDEDQIAELLSRQFNLPREETQAYLKLLDTSDLTIEQLAKELNLTGEGTEGLVASMIERGLIIEATGTPKRYGNRTTQERKVSWSVLAVAGATDWNCSVSCPYYSQECPRRVHSRPPSPSLLPPFESRLLPSDPPPSPRVLGLRLATAPPRCLAPLGQTFRPSSAAEKPPLVPRSLRTPVLLAPPHWAFRQWRHWRTLSRVG